MFYKKLLFWLLAFTILNLKTAQADDEPVKPWRIDTAIGFFSDYMFRGQNLYPGTSIQPSVTGTYDSAYGLFSGNLWMHLSGEGGEADGPEPYTEMDETLRYTYSTELYALSTGIAWYTYPDSSDDIHSTSEVSASIAFNTTLTPVLSVYHDMDEFDSQYYERSISHIFENIAGDASLTPFAGAGLASNSEKIYADDGLVQTTVGLTPTIPAGEVTVAPSVNYTFESDANAVNQLWVGTTLSFSF